MNRIDEIRKKTGFDDTKVTSVIVVRKHLPMLYAILGHYGIPRESLELSHDIQVWCCERNISESNPFRGAKCILLTPEKCHIVLRHKQTETMVLSAKHFMVQHGFETEVEALNTDAKYLAHLILHEIACFILQTTDQQKRDEWAFKELSNHAA